MSKDVTIREGREQRTFLGVKKLITSGNIKWIPENDVSSEDLTAAWGEIDLTDTEWHLGTCQATSSSGESYSVSFTTDVGSYSSMWWQLSGGSYLVNATPTGSPSIAIYSNGTWYPEGNSVWRITGGTDVNNPNLLYWLLKASVDDFSEREKYEMYMNALAGIITRKASATGGATIDQLITRVKSI